MRCFIILGTEKMELEDSFFSQYLTENTSVYLESKMYRVSSIKRVLLKSGNNLDSELEIYLDE